MGKNPNVEKSRGSVSFNQIHTGIEDILIGTKHFWVRNWIFLLKIQRLSVNINLILHDDSGNIKMCSLLYMLTETGYSRIS